MSGQRTIGGYRLGRRIAVGGMAELFEARAPGTEGGRWPLVLKLMLPNAAEEPEFARMFADEGQLAAGLDHEHLVRVLEHGVEGEQPFIAMERVDGTSLALLVRRGGALAVPLALGVAEALLEALAYIHSRRDEQGRPLHIVHRDVTPGNVLLSRLGAVKLGDFGIARSRLQRTRTRTGVIKGTVQYMAPEQVTDSGVDQRTDIYAVGLVLFEMLTGRRLLDAEREVDLIRLAECPPWVAPSSLNPAVDPEVDRLLRPALAQFPEERYGAAQSFLKALRRTRAARGLAAFDAGELGALVCQAAPPVAASVPSEPAAPSGGSGAAEPPSVTPAPSGGTTRTAGRRWIGGGLLVAAFAGGLLLALGPSRQPAPPPRPADGSAAPPVGLSRRRADISVAAVGPTDSGSTAADAGSAGAGHVAARPPDAGRPRPRRRLRPSQRRTSVRRPPDAAVRDPSTDGAAPAAAARRPIAACRGRVAAARAELQGRGVLPGDLPGAVRQRLAAAASLCSKARREASAPLSALEADLRKIVVDRGFIQVKIRRVDRRLRRSPSNRPDLPQLREKAGLALQAFLDGQYRRANQRLNQILSLIGEG